MDSYLDALESSHRNGMDKLTEFLEPSTARSFIFPLDIVGSGEDKLLTLIEAKKTSGVDHSTKYLALRIKPGASLDKIKQEVGGEFCSNKPLS